MRVERHGNGRLRTASVGGESSMYAIDQETAQELVEFVSGETGYNMIVCDASGVIIGDSLKERFGVRHDGAARIMGSEMDYIAVSKEDEIRTERRTREGYNCVIKVDEARIGTFGIGGPVVTVRPIAKIAAAVIAARIKEMQHMELIRSVVAEISESVHQAAEALREISSGSAELAATGSSLAQAALHADEEVKATNKILEFILDVADQTKLLGLNAAIVAAQAGTHGRGFGVVAGEIRKLATNSASSVEQITTILKKIRSAITKVSSSSAETSTISTEQSRAVEEITRFVEKIQESVNLLVTSVGNR
jgi:sugar diacid utilization regulator